MSDCPNCGKGVPEGERICPHCGFDTGEAQADDVRALREAGQIHPGRIGAGDPNDFSGEDEGELRASRAESEMPAEDRTGTGPEELEGGL
jgi:hypothetical protein